MNAQPPEIPGPPEPGARMNTLGLSARHGDVAQDAAAPARPVQDMLSAIRAGLSDDHVSIGTMLRTIPQSAHPVLLLLPALILITPLSGIPGLSSLGGLTIALVAVQMLLGRPRIWLPRLVLDRQIATHRLAGALDWLARPAAYIDRKTTARAAWAFGFPLCHMALTLCILCGLAMPFLELVPFSATTLAVVVTVLASALLVRDGVLLLLGAGGFGLAVLVITKLLII